MFSSLRYISIVVLFFMIIVTVLAGIYLKHSFVDNTVKSFTEDQSSFISNTFTRGVWNNFYPAIASLYDIPRSDWDFYPQYMIFKDEVDKLLRGNKDIEKIIIYSPKLDIIYDSDPTIKINLKNNELLIFESQRDDRLILQNTLAGYKEVNIIYNINVKEGEATFKKSILKSYIPIYVTDIVSGTEDLAKKAVAVMEINYDISNSIRNLETLQFTLVFIVTSALSIIMITIFLSSQKAETLLEKQQEASLEMAAAKASAEAESKAKSMFLANVSHELRTPLNAIIGFSEIIISESMGALGNESYKEFIKDINTSGVHLLSLINDILDFSKAEENKLTIDNEFVDITKVCKICARMVTPRADESKITIVENLPTAHTYINADAKRLKQAILNLLSNAVKFTPEGGTVTISAYLEEDSKNIIIQVSDTGVGMAAQDIAKALSPFGQIDNKLSRRYEGTGLGLPLTKKLVEIMKGKFDIHSELGLGTSVTLTFALTEYLEVDS